MTCRPSSFLHCLGLALLLAWPVSGWAQQNPWQDGIATSVLGAIQRDPALAASTITVDCYNGTVMLTGFVSSFELRNNAEAAAMSTPGVIRVLDELNQNQDRSSADAARDGVIQTTLQTTLSQYGTGDPPIVMARGRVYDSIVYLLGAVSDPSMNAILQSSIMALPGVHAVVAHLAIQKGMTPIPPAPAVDDTGAAPVMSSAPLASPPLASVPLASAPLAPAPLAPAPLATERLRIAPSRVAAAAQARSHPRPYRGAPAVSAYAVQLASEPSEAAAMAAWHKRRSANADLLARLEPAVSRADLGTRGVRYRLKAGPLPDQEAAAELCVALAARHAPCLVVRETGDAAAAGPPPASLPASPPSAEPADITTSAETKPATVAAHSKPKPAAIAKHAKPKPAAIAQAAPPRHPTKAGAGSYAVQLASRGSEAEARAYWRDLVAKNRTLLGHLAPTVAEADLGAKGIHYRLKAGPLAGRNAAAALCASLKARGLDCLPVREIGAASSAP